MLDCYFVCVYVVVHSRRGKGVRIHSRSPAWISWERGSEGACSRQEKNKEQDQSTGATRFAPKPYPLAPLPVISSSLNCCPVRSCGPGLLVSLLHCSSSCINLPSDTPAKCIMCITYFTDDISWEAHEPARVVREQAISTSTPFISQIFLHVHKIISISPAHHLPDIFHASL